jgi:RNA polymerase primary sigma factor
MKADRSPGSRSQIARYFADIKDFPLLTREEEIQLGKHIAEGLDESVERLVVSNLRFVVKVAREYRHLGVPIEDLMSEGNLGLIKAAQRYDHTKGFRFVTYAMWWIRKSIIDAILSQRVVRIPHYQFKKYSTLKAHLEAEHARHDPADAGPGRSCRSCDQGPEEPLHAIFSLNGTGQDPDGHEMIDRLVDDLAEDPEDAIIRNTCLARLEEGLSRLDSRERRVLALRFGMGDRRETTLKEIGTALGVCKERVRQIETEAIQKLRALMLDSTPAPGKAGSSRRLKH